MTLTLESLSNIMRDVISSMTKQNKFSSKLEDMNYKPFSQFLKIKLLKNEKTPINKWKSPTNQIYNIDEQNYNIGIPTGRMNNLIVLDIDIKKEHKQELDGVAKINEYLNKNGNIKTLTVQTPSGGTHYYFTFNGK